MVITQNSATTTKPITFIYIQFRIICLNELELYLYIG